MKDDLFCPLIQQKCKKKECVMWELDFCLVNVYLSSNAIAPTLQNDTQNLQDEKLNAIFSHSADILAEEILQFAKDKKYINEDSSFSPFYRETEELFWLEKGLDVNTLKLPEKYRTIKRKAWLLASANVKTELNKKREEKNDNEAFSSFGRLEKENDETEITSLSEEVLAKELLDFGKEMKLGQNEGDNLNRETLEFFWQSKGLQNTSYMSSTVAIKIKTVENIARNMLCDEVFSVSNDELSKELASLAKKKAGSETGQGVYVGISSHVFWRHKGLGGHKISVDTEQKKDEVERLAQEIIDNEFRAYRGEQIEEEKKLLPDLVQSCTEWARNTGRKQVTIKDVKFFIYEKNLDILDATERSLYLTTNNELKTL